MVIEESIPGPGRSCQEIATAIGHLERRLPGSGLERCPGCHPERSEGSLRPSSQTLRCAQGDRHYLQMSTGLVACGCQTRCIMLLPLLTWSGVCDTDDCLSGILYFDLDRYIVR